MDFSCSKWRPQVEVLGLLINTKSKTKTEILRGKVKLGSVLGPIMHRKEANKGDQSRRSWRGRNCRYVLDYKKGERLW